MPIDPNATFRHWGSSVTIEELDPPVAGGQPRVLQLFGSAQPFQGAEWAVENNVVTTWYPGNGVEGTQQNLGPRELPSTWEGEWKRTLLGKHPASYQDEGGTKHQIISPHVLRELVEDMMRTGLRLRVTWAVNGGQHIGPVGVTSSGERIALGLPSGGFGKDIDIDVKIVREGRMKMFKTPIDRHTDIRWTMEFHWMSRGGVGDKVAAIRTEDDYSKVSNGVDASLKALDAFNTDKLKQLKAGVFKSASLLTLGQLEALAGAPLAAVNGFLGKMRSTVAKLKQIGDIVKKLRAQPFAIANAVVDFARNTTAIANNFVDAMGRVPPEQMTLKSKVSSLLRATKHFGHISDQAIVSARRGHELEGSVAKLTSSPAGRGASTVRETAHNKPGDLIAIYLAKQGDTPGTVSTKYYQSADHAVDILRANKLPWFLPAFKRGQVLIIPVLKGSSNSAGG